MRLEHLREERREAASFDRDVRVEVEKEPAVRVAQADEFLDLQEIALAIELGARLALGNASEELRRRDGEPVRPRRPDERLIADGPALPGAEDRLEVARKVKRGGCADALRRAIRAQAPRCDVQQLQDRLPSFSPNA